METSDKVHLSHGIRTRQKQNFRRKNWTSHSFLDASKKGKLPQSLQVMLELNDLTTWLLLKQQEEQPNEMGRVAMHGATAHCGA